MCGPPMGLCLEIAKLVGVIQYCAGVDSDVQPRRALFRRPHCGHCSLGLSRLIDLVQHTGSLLRWPALAVEGLYRPQHCGETTAVNRTRARPSTCMGCQLRQPKRPDVLLEIVAPGASRALRCGAAGDPVCLTARV